MWLRFSLNTSSLVYIAIFALSITEVSMSFSIKSDTQRKYEANQTSAYFRISDIILPPLPALELLALISYSFLIFLHVYKRKKLMFAMNPENIGLVQQPAKEKDDGFWFFTLFKSFLISLFHALAIFFTTKAKSEYETIDNLNNGQDNTDLISRVNSILVLNIVSLVLYYVSVIVDTFIHYEERKFYRDILYKQASAHD